ncbi:MAG TPA: valine--tRNA ligase [Candidatus Norongarragalinales archaeon]|nr:valine--tRNA ligase [Candidatus Norongarragalinales archaeon]
MEKPNFPEMEARWRKRWEELQIHNFEDDGKAPLYVIDTPPPFPTGEFHTGSTLNWGYIDFAARYKRMRGYAVLFPQGWDCHGFPTETKVEAKYGKLPREQFREKCLEWTHAMVASIKEQMKQMGFSIDWRHEYYTIDKEYHRKVQLSLLEMHEQGLVYCGKHPVLFCTHCESAIAKAETDDGQREGLLNFIKFKFEAGKDLLIATSRPELIHACVALAYNPADPRYAGLEGKMAFTPVFNKPVRIVADPAVDEAFGSGMVMVCTFGDMQDVAWAYKFHLPIIEAFDEKGRVINANADYNGLYANKARAKIIEEMAGKGILEKQEKLQQIVKIHDRCKKPVELLASRQWFIRVREHKAKIVKAAESMVWRPAHSLQLLKDWAAGLEWDWVISRQRVFGIPIPFYYCNKCNEVYVPKKSELPIDPASHAFHQKKCAKCENGEIVGETSICDGWVDSSITPLVISKWGGHDKDFGRLYPSAIRPQGTDIIRTWAFYTIFRCLMLTGKPPFKEMLVNGMVLGSDGKKMSKSAGNYIEAKEVIAKSSVDSLRQWIALSGTTGKDNIFYWKDVIYAQGFLTKLWNVANFVQKSSEGYDWEKDKAHGKDGNLAYPQNLRAVDKWILGRLDRTIRIATESMENYDYYGAIIAIQSFFWKELADYYLEEIKYRIYHSDVSGKDGKEACLWVLHKVLLQSLKLLAPFACYTTEEIYHQLYPKEALRVRSIHLEKWPEISGGKPDEASDKAAEALHFIISEARKFKALNKLPLNESLSSIKLKIPAQVEHYLPLIEEEIMAVARPKRIELEIWKNEEIGVECSV